jgi:hypothetical protein
VITAIDGTPVKAPGDLSAQILAHSPGDTVKLDVRHNGQTSTVSVQLGTRPSQLNNSSGQQNPGGPDQGPDQGGQGQGSPPSTQAGGH